MLASVVFLFYDIVTALDIEIVRVWRGKFNPFTVLCTLVSYLCVSLNIASELEQNRWLISYGRSPRVP